MPDLSWFTGAVWFAVVVVVMGGLMVCLAATAPHPTITHDTEETP